MIYSQLGKTGLRVSRLGFGCMRLPEKDGKIDRASALRLIDAAYRGGVNYFDTAYLYHNGDSEAFLAEALASYPRESYLVADKLPAWLVKSQEDVPRFFHEQLERCGLEYFDLYLLHSMGTQRRWAEMGEARAYEQLAQMKKDGLIRALGFSFHGDYETLCEMVDTCEWDFVQIQTNYLDDVMINSKAFHDKLTAKGIPCVVMEPVRGGYLAELPPAAERELRAVNDDSSAAWALRWCLDQDNMPVILSGMSTMEQVEENLTTFGEHRPFSAEERASLARARDAMLAIRTIPCTGCRYCMDCPSGVEIPDVFGAFNRYELFQNPLRTKGDYDFIGPEHNAEKCTDCGACVPLCPQGIAIPERLAQAHKAITDLYTS